MEFIAHDIPNIYGISFLRNVVFILSGDVNFKLRALYVANTNVTEALIRCTILQYIVSKDYSHKITLEVIPCSKSDLTNYTANMADLPFYTIQNNTSLCRPGTYTVSYTAMMKVLDL